MHHQPGERVVSEVEELLERTLDRPYVPLSARERRTDRALGALLVATGALMALLLPWQRDAGPEEIALVVGLCAVMSRIEVPIGSGLAVPTIPVIVVALFVVPPALAPLLIVAGYVLGALLDVAHPRRVGDRVTIALPGAWQVVGAAAVLVAAGAPDAGDVRAVELLGAFAAGCLADALSAVIRERVSQELPAPLQLRVLARVWLIDALLAGPALLTLRAAETDPWAPLLAVPLVLGLALSARERLAHLRQSARRGQQAEAERVKAQTDHLTGLSNVRRFEDVLDHWLTRTDESVALALFDIDDFKAVNDTYGHQAGDLVLQAVATVLRDCCRAGDEPARTGGEELAIVAPSTGTAGAWQLADRVRAAVEELEITTAIGGPLRVTVSAGVATTGPQRDRARLVSDADRALYDAKRSGKNRVRVADGAAVVTI